MINRQGNLSINSENIFPIIKKWLYSDQDIFIREMISNGCDAITKLRKLALMGEYDAPADETYEIHVDISPKGRTISFTDNGLGMTADEVDEYINQIAFSGAAGFLQKYRDKATDDQIIGHFGLGFYSAFMVADKVSIDTLSYREGAEAVHWESTAGTDFSMSPSERTERGTTVTITLSSDCLKYSNWFTVREVLVKYCGFMPEPIYLTDLDEEVRKAAEAAKKAVEADAAARTAGEKPGTEDAAGTPEDGTEKAPEAPKPVNDTHPLWTKHPNECTDEDYKKFYIHVFHDYREPLFWIHLNMDYPFNLKGILYFPKLNLAYDKLEGTIKLYNNQVFIADNIKEVIPEYLLLLKGVIDCPDLPLNVSRSALQNDGFVTKISDYINKKVADKLNGMFKTDRENYEKYWNDIAPFIKYGYLRDDKFGDKIFDSILFRDIEEKYLNFKELTEEKKDGAVPAATDENGNAVEAEVVSEGAWTGGSAETEAAPEPGEAPAEAAGTAEGAENAGPEKQTVYYVTDERDQGQYVRMFREQGRQAVILDQGIDMPFLQKVEQTHDTVRFCRIDADVSEYIKNDAGGTDEKANEKLAEKIKKLLNIDNLLVRVEDLKDPSAASVISFSEETLRVREMMKQYGIQGGMSADGMGAEGQTLILNADHPLVKYIEEHGRTKLAEKISRQLYDLALVSNTGLPPERMHEFVQRTNEIMLELTK